MCSFSSGIEHFLGKQVLSNQIVQNSKLPDDEHEQLDCLLTVEELDLWVEKCNLRSAPDIDGLNNYFIQKFWYLLLVPLLNYSLRCCSTGCLTTNFTTASIKLIPKKGELSSLKNCCSINLSPTCIKYIPGNKCLA
jgi:hypothetical protein